MQNKNSSFSLPYYPFGYSFRIEDGKYATESAKIDTTHLLVLDDGENSNGDSAAVKPDPQAYLTVLRSDLEALVSAFRGQ